MTVCALVGGQFGSEGKGLIASKIASNYDDHIRVGAANAGHTLYGVDDNKHVMQSIPCAAYANPDADLYIGPGALISPEIFRKELIRWTEWRAWSGLERKRVIVDARAQVITQEHIDRERATDLAERIGSTSTIAKEGIGAAQAARVMREEGCVTAAEYFMTHAMGHHPGDELDWMSPGDWSEMIEIRDVPMMLRGDFSPEKSILMEGTQGTSLSLTTGTHPYITSRNTTAAGLAADCGIAPGRVDRVILVMRTFPIRVAGNSGPFWHDSVEMSWGDINVDPQSERTTVTKKIRRVATFSFDQLEEAVVLNGATEIALTFCDYLSPRLHDVSDSNELDSDADYRVFNLIDKIEEVADVPVSMIGTGPRSIIVMP